MRSFSQGPESVEKLRAAIDAIYDREGGNQVTALG